MVIGLVVIGLLLVVLGVWIIRQTRVDLDVLAPLERMGDSEWKKRDRSTQRRMLDEVRPEGARPLAPATQPPSLDDEFELAEHPVTSFSDLGPGVSSEERDPTPVGTDAEPVIEPSEERDPTPVGTKAEPVFESVAEQVAEPVVEPSEERDRTPVGTDAEPVAESVAEPVAEPVVETVADPDAEPATDPRD
jgi:hypothetical protein